MAHKGDILAISPGFSKVATYSLEGLLVHAVPSFFSLKVCRKSTGPAVPIPLADMVSPSTVRTLHSMGLAGTGGSTRPYSVQGSVKEQGTPCRRLIRVYRRDNGGLLVSGYSDLPGNKFHLRWAGYSGQVFIVAFDDLGVNPDFNCRVYDLITPE